MPVSAMSCAPSGLSTSSGTLACRIGLLGTSHQTSRPRCDHRVAGGVQPDEHVRRCQLRYAGVAGGQVQVFESGELAKPEAFGDVAALRSHR